MHRSATLALSFAAAAVGGGCAHGRALGSYSPVNATAWYGNRTEDGVTLVLRLEPDAAIARVRGTLQSAGYIVADPGATRATLRTAAHVVGGDTTMAVMAQILPVEIPESASSVVLTGTFDVPSRNVHSAPVIQRPGEINPLYGRLRALADLLGKSQSPAP